MNRHKYGRTYHLPFSKGLGDDDKLLSDYSHLDDEEVVATIKMDGENTSLYSDGYSHARSIDSRHHASRDWVKKFWAERYFNMPTGYRVCGENLYAMHSIFYDDLESYFYGFSVWDEHNRCLTWDDTLFYFEELGITPVKQVYRGKFDLKVLKELADGLDTERHEGFVVRKTGLILQQNFSKSIAKFVRAGHVQTDTHWAEAPIISNVLKPAQ